MENKTERSERLQKLFANHPKVKIFYLTSDDQAFTEKHRAEAHGQTLENKEVDNYPRFVAEAVELAKEKITARKAEKANADTQTGSEDQKSLGNEGQADGEQGAADDKAGDENTQGSEGAGSGDQGTDDKKEGEGDPPVDQKPLDEKAALQVRYKELFGKAVNHMTGVPKLKADIAAKEAELAK